MKFIRALPVGHSHNHLKNVTMELTLLLDLVLQVLPGRVTETREPHSADQEDDADAGLLQPVEGQPGVSDVGPGLECDHGRMDDHQDSASGQDGPVWSYQELRLDVGGDRPVGLGRPALHPRAVVRFRTCKGQLKKNTSFLECCVCFSYFVDVVGNQLGPIRLELNVRWQHSFVVLFLMPSRH